MDQDVAVFQICSHGRGVGDKVGTQVALVELHAFHEFDFSVEAFAFFHSDDAVLAHFVHGFGNDFADLGILVGGTGADLGDFLGVTHGLTHLGQLAGNGVNPDVDATLHFVGVGTGSDVLEAFGEDGFGVNRRGGGAITGILGGLAGHFFDHLCAHVLEGVFEFNFLGDGDTIFGDGGSAKGLFKNHHAAGGAEGALHRFGEFLDATKHAFAGVNVVSNFFCGHGGFLLAHSAVGANQRGRAGGPISTRITLPASTRTSRVPSVSFKMPSSSAGTSKARATTQSSQPSRTRRTSRDPSKASKADCRWEAWSGISQSWVRSGFQIKVGFATPWRRGKRRCRSRFVWW